MSKARKKQLSRQAMVWSGGILGGIIVLAALFLGIRLTGQLLFSRNDRFNITNLDIRDEGNIASYFIRHRKGISEGTNIFSFSTAHLREEFLQQRFAAKYKSMDISRVLPGTLSVALTERVPLARIGSWGNLVVDRDGCVFGVRSGSRDLPTIAGYPGAGLKPGVRLQGSAIAALEALMACDDPRLGIPVQSVDVDEEDELVLFLKPGAKAKGFKLRWVGMGERTRESREALMRQLMRVSQALSQSGSRRHSMLDVTYDDRIFGS